MSAVAVTEVEYRASINEMFKALDMDRNDSLDWGECRDMVSAVMKQDGGYNADSFKAKYDSMDQNDDGKISKSEFIEAVVEIGRERMLFGVRPSGKKLANSGVRVAYAVADTSEDPVDIQLFREGLSCLGKTFNNARHAYLKLNMSDKALTTIKVSLHPDFLNQCHSIFVGRRTLQVPLVYRRVKQLTDDAAVPD